MLVIEATGLLNVKSMYLLANAPAKEDNTVIEINQ